MKGILTFVFLLFAVTKSAFSQSTTEWPVVMKCECNGDEVLTVSGCEKRSPLSIRIWDKATENETIADLTQMPYIIMKPRCDSNATNDVFFDHVFITKNGSIIKYPYETYDYCIENVINAEGQLLQRIELCVEKLQGNLCCQKDEYINAAMSCTKIPDGPGKDYAVNLLKKFSVKVTENYLDCGSSERQHDSLHEAMSLTELKNMFLHYQKLTNNTFCLGLYGDENEIYPAATYCRSTTAGRSNHGMIPYCCPESFAFDLSLGECIPYNEVFSFPQNIEWPSEGAIQTPSVMNCSIFSVLQLNKNERYILTSDGSLQIESGRSIPFHKYCIGKVISNSSSHSGLLCLSLEEERVPCPWRWTLNRVLLGISSAFLVVTLVVYIGVAELRRKIGSLCLISELIALLASQITLIVLQTRQSTFTASGCSTAGVIELVFVLASFFWLNIMCYDVWSTFRVLRPFCEKVVKIKLFLKYSVYGWGIPLFIGTVAAILEANDINLRPNFSPDRSCFFADHNPELQWLYMYGLILLLLLINCGFFIHLSFTLIRSNMEQRKHLNSANSQSTCQQNQDIENIKLYGKLFIIMGLPWLFEVFTSFASKETLCYIWFLDVLNALRGILIFIIFLCKKSTRDVVVSAWFPSYKPKPASSSQASRKTSLMSLSWLPSIYGRKISKVSLGAAAQVNLETLKEETQQQQKEQITETSLQEKK